MRSQTWQAFHLLYRSPAFVSSTNVIAFSAIACILVGFLGLTSSTLRGLALPAADTSV